MSPHEAKISLKLMGIFTTEGAVGNDSADERPRLDKDLRDPGLGCSPLCDLVRKCLAEEIGNQNRFSIPFYLHPLIQFNIHLDEGTPALDKIGEDGFQSVGQ